MTLNLKWSLFLVECFSTLRLGPFFIQKHLNYAKNLVIYCKENLPNCDCNIYQYMRLDEL